MTLYEELPERFVRTLDLTACLQHGTIQQPKADVEVAVVDDPDSEVVTVTIGALPHPFTWDFLEAIPTPKLNLAILRFLKGCEKRTMSIADAIENQLKILAEGGCIPAIYHYFMGVDPEGETRC